MAVEILHWCIRHFSSIPKNQKIAADARHDVAEFCLEGPECWIRYEWWRVK